MQVTRTGFRAFLLIITVALGVYLIALIEPITRAQVAASAELKPDLDRAMPSQANTSGDPRRDSYEPTSRESGIRPRNFAKGSPHAIASAADFSVRTFAPEFAIPGALARINAGTPLSQILHTSQISLTSSAGTDEQYVDRTGDLVADERTTFDFVGGSFDTAVGQSGARYEVYSATLSGALIGVLVVAFDTNGDYVADSSSTYNLKADFNLPSAAAVVAGVSRSGRDFVIVSSSGYYNAANPNDPHNE